MFTKKSKRVHLGPPHLTGLHGLLGVKCCDSKAFGLRAGMELVNDTKRHLQMVSAKKKRSSGWHSPAVECFITASQPLKGGSA